MAPAVIAVASLLWLVVALRLVALLPLPRGLRVALALLALPLAQYWVLANLWFGSFARMELPRGVVLALGWAFGAVLLAGLLALARDVVVGLFALAHRRAARTLLRSRVLAAALGVLALVLASWGTWQGVRVPDVQRVTIAVPGLPAAFAGYRIAQLSDLHASPLLRAPWVEAVVRRTNALGADLVVVTGDFQDGTVAARRADVAPLADLAAPDGVLGVPGNHEYYTDYGAWMAALRALGVDMLENAHVVLTRGAARLGVVGLTDPQARSFGLPAPDLDAARAGLPPETPFIVLTHHPSEAFRSAAAGAALHLAGHTHGGQIRGPDLLTRWANRGLLSGRYRIDGMPLYVSNGTGLWHGLVLRLGRSAEITLITLLPAP